jgi:glycosyl transferase family 2
MSDTAAGPCVGVVVPCYNYGRYLRECVTSVLAQTGVDVRVLIIDDASTDDTAAVAAELVADPRVEVRRHPVNQGHTRTYNEGIRWVTGRYTVVLDADDLLTPGALQRAGALLDAHPNVGFVYGRALIFRDGHARPRPRTEPVGWKIWSGSDWFELRCRMTECCIYSPEIVVRTALLQQLGGFRAELPHAGDFELWMRLALYADVGYVKGPDQAYYRDHAAGMHRQQFGTVLADLVQVKAAFEVLFREHTEAIADGERLEAIVRRMLARRALRAACRAYDQRQQDPAEVLGLEELALTTYAAACTLGEWRGLQRRKWLGPRLCWLLQPFTLLTAQRVFRALQRLRLEREGLCVQRAGGL